MKSAQFRGWGQNFHGRRRCFKLQKLFQILSLKMKKMLNQPSFCIVIISVLSLHFDDFFREGLKKCDCEKGVGSNPENGALGIITVKLN